MSLSKIAVLTSSELKKLEMQSAEIIKKAGKKVFESWGKTIDVSYKDKRDLFTKVDLESENFLRCELLALFANAGFIVEEGESDKKFEYNWTIDPLDGSKNFAFQLPMFFVQVALLYKDNPILGHIYHPLSGQLFSASYGNGVSLNGKQLSSNVSDQRDIKQAIIDIDLGGKDIYSNENCNILTTIFNNVYRLRISGGAFPPYLLTGAIDGYLVLNQKTKLVDQAPRIILFREAGLTTEYIEYGKRHLLVSANEVIFSQIKSLILSTVESH
jgi:myo-inositol-1(or 4)-monophosphatase